MCGWDQEAHACHQAGETAHRRCCMTDPQRLLGLEPRGPCCEGCARMHATSATAGLPRMPFVRGPPHNHTSGVAPPHEPAFASDARHDQQHGDDRAAACRVLPPIARPMARTHVVIALCVAMRSHLMADALRGRDVAPMHTQPML